MRGRVVQASPMLPCNGEGSLCASVHTEEKKNGNFVLLLSQLRARSRVLYSTPTLGGLVSVSRLETKKGTMPSF